MPMSSSTCGTSLNCMISTCRYVCVHHNPASHLRCTDCSSFCSSCPVLLKPRHNCGILSSHLQYTSVLLQVITSSFSVVRQSQAGRLPSTPLAYTC